MARPEADTRRGDEELVRAALATLTAMEQFALKANVRAV
jgi:hypothetical protein